MTKLLVVPAAVLGLAGFAQAPGSADVSFAPADVGYGRGDGPVGYFHTVVRQSDGRLIVGGSFNWYTGVAPGWVARSNVLRLNTDGTLDGSFDTSNGPNAAVDDLVLQPDGKVILVGAFDQVAGVPQNDLARLNATGVLDPGFSTGSGFNGPATDAALDANGRLVVVGDFTSYNGQSCGRIVRLNANGSFDPTFATGTGFDGSASQIAVDWDGSVFVCGNFNSFNGTGVPTGLVRLTASGALDAIFQPAIQDRVHAFALVIGLGVYVRGSSGVVMRLALDGSEDPLFTTTLTSGTFGSALVADGQGVLLCGSQHIVDGTPVGNISRLTWSGGLDPSFSTFGMFPEGYSLDKLIVQPDGKLVVLGVPGRCGDRVRQGIARLTTSGAVDTGFNTATGVSGVAMAPISDVLCMARQTDGRIVLGGGFTGYDDRYVGRIVRILADGARDGTFETGAGANNVIHALAVQSDGKVLVGGAFDSFNGSTSGRIVRLLPNGQLDGAFSIAGANDVVRSIKVQPDGRILVAGMFDQFNGSVTSGVVRLLANGSLDPSFNVAMSDGPYDGVLDIELAADGSVFLAGRFTSVNGGTRRNLAKVSGTGVLQSSFDPGAGPEGPAVYVNDSELQPDGRLLIAGTFTSYAGEARSGLARVLASGAIDPSFVPPDGLELGHVVKVQANGKVLVGGWTSPIGQVMLMRLHPNGGQDAGFDTGPSMGWSVSSLLALPDGKWMVGGEFLAIGGAGRNRIARLYGGDVSIQVGPRVLLGGAYTSGGLQPDALRTAGLLPMGEPYSAAGFQHTGEGGQELLGAGVLGVAGPNAVVDWVVVELRSGAYPDQVLASRSALVQADGDVVAVDGVSRISYSAMPGNYHVAVRHRNHLPVMTAAPVALSSTSATVDFTLPTTATWGTDARKSVGGVLCLWPGDTGSNGQVKYTGTGNDRDPILQAIGGTTPTATVSNVYSPLDTNLDGVVKYTGAGNDRDLILQTIGGTVPTAVRAQQLP